MFVKDLIVPTYTNMLRALASWLKKADETLDDADAVLSERLAPDMFPLATQIRFSCVQAYEGCCRLTNEAFPAVYQELLDEGREGGSTPGTVESAITRIETTLAFLDGHSDEDWEANATKSLGLELPMGIAFDFTGEEYVRDWALPQFYFHVMTAYAILRHKGVALGKADYVAHAFQYIRPGTEPQG